MTKTLMLWMMITTLILISLSGISLAQNQIYPVAPQNDISLVKVESKRPNLHYAKRIHHHFHKHRSRIAQISHHHKPKKLTGLFIYYALPATACCGETWGLEKINEYRSWDKWRNSPTVAFRTPSDEILHSATNDDSFRWSNLERNQSINEVIEDPMYY
ncbi:MAG TPA: hypothetical protein VHA13_03020 [Gammaproteobacteria bacterium]|nr:hypothetical protein [Gammaproteobacteria bacterium]